ncbi:hypothetical protein JXC34_04055 [Candidatus Woesearchaeota archaeon]|nr:hypothetical protein [Candidatus Woesearchaeota archaeon]
MVNLPKYSFFIIFFLIALGFFLTFKFLDREPGSYDNFAGCLAESGAKMYGAWWCGHCSDQKQMFGKSWEIMIETGAYVECAKDDRSFNELCRQEGITGVPIWKFKDGSELRGKQNFYVLSQKTGCQIDTI